MLNFANAHIGAAGFMSYSVGRHELLLGDLVLSYLFWLLACDWFLSVAVFLMLSFIGFVFM